MGDLSDEAVKLGSLCTVLWGLRRTRGILRFVGETDFGWGVWAGIEVREGSGEHDGTVEGTRYFTTKRFGSRNGLFAKLSSVVFDRAFSAAKLSGSCCHADASLL